VGGLTNFRLENKMVDITDSFKILLLSGPGVDTSRLTGIYQANSRLSISIKFKAKNLVVDNKIFKLQIWNLSVDDKRFKFLYANYIKGARGVLFIFDITRENWVAELQDGIDGINEVNNSELLFKCPKVALGDTPIRQHDTKFVKMEGLDQFIEGSLTTGENVEKAFEALTRLIIERNDEKKSISKEKFSDSIKIHARWEDDDYSKSDFKLKSRITPSKMPSKLSLNLPLPPKVPDEPTVASLNKDSDSKENFNINPDVTRAISSVNSMNAQYIMISGIMHSISQSNSKRAPPVAENSNMDPELKGEIQSLLEWIKDSEGLSGYINYYLEQNNHQIIAELSKIYAELRQIFGI